MDYPVYGSAEDSLGSEIVDGETRRNDGEHGGWVLLFVFVLAEAEDVFVRMYGCMFVHTQHFPFIIRIARLLGLSLALSLSAMI